jgi:hypothetical protein
MMPGSTTSPRPSIACEGAPEVSSGEAGRGNISLMGTSSDLATVTIMGL